MKSHRNKEMSHMLEKRNGKTKMRKMKRKRSAHDIRQAISLVKYTKGIVVAWDCIASH